MSFAVRTLAAGAGIATAAVFWIIMLRPLPHATALIDALVGRHARRGCSDPELPKVGQPSEMDFTSGSGDASFDGLAPGDWSTAAKPGTNRDRMRRSGTRT